RQRWGVCCKQVPVAVGKATVGVVLIRVPEAGGGDDVAAEDDVGSGGKEIIGSDVADASVEAIDRSSGTGVGKVIDGVGIRKGRSALPVVVVLVCSEDANLIGEFIVETNEAEVDLLAEVEGAAAQAVAV